jgi:ABC-type multidrug transport system fused ATPase/permease subunit
MNVAIGFVIAIVATALAIAAMLLVRRRAPDGSFFADGDRASGVFGVLASGFAILLGFIIFLAFTTYDESRAGAEAEAVTVAQQVETAQHFEAQPADALTGALVCYARYVAGPEWERLEDRSLGDELNPWTSAMFRTLQTVEPQTASEEAAYSKWLDQTADRQSARQDRVHGAVGVIPTPLWIVLFTISVVIFVYMLFFADKGERAVTQALLMGSVVFVIVTLMLLLHFLDNPFRPGIGSLRPVAMERTLRILDEELEVAEFDAPLPCDDAGLANETEADG